MSSLWRLFCYYNYNMFLALALLTIQQMTIVSYLINSHFLADFATSDVRAMFGFIAFFTFLLSVPTIIWNHYMMKEYGNPQNYIGFVFSTLAVVLGAVMFGFWFYVGVTVAGGRIF